jgi:hypothetical protein
MNVPEVAESQNESLNRPPMRTILFEDPLGKRTLSLSTPVYESIKEFILTVLLERGEVTFIELLSAATQNGSLRYEGDMNWCFLVVKRDLEARGIVKVTMLGRSRVQVLSLTRKKRSALALMSISAAV